MILLKTLRHGVAQLILLASIAHAGEIIIHRGPTVDLEIVGRLDRERNEEVMKFIKEFSVDSALLAKLPAAAADKATLPVSKQQAQEAAIKTVDNGAGDNDDERGKIDFVSAELKTTRTGGEKEIDFYLVEFKARGSGEHRIVLMDGSVVKPVLRRSMPVKK